MLVDTTCDDQCDWQRLTQVPYVFKSGQEIPYDEMFVRDVAFDSPGDAVTLAKYMKYSRQATGQIEELEQTNSCSVPGCCLPFPPHPSSNAKHGFSYKHERGRKLVWHAKHLCLAHYKRLKHSGDRNDFAALDRFHKMMCESNPACLAPDLEYLLVNFPCSSKHKRANVSYERVPGVVDWTLNGRRTLRDCQLQQSDLQDLSREDHRVRHRPHTRADSKNTCFIL